jgi:hypothetical protein
MNPDIAKDGPVGIHRFQRRFEETRKDGSRTRL